VAGQQEGWTSGEREMVEGGREGGSEWTPVIYINMD